jgi:hypothetical protein
MQAGDQVAYITALHEQFISKELLADSGMSGPQQLPATSFRTSEPCEVLELHYYIEQASKMTVVRATLRLLEGTGARRTSNSKNTFVVEIPPPLVGEFSEFVVKLSTFQEQVTAVLDVGSPVNSYMVNADGRSQFYRGTVVADKLEGTALDSSELYTVDVVERYTVRPPLLLFKLHVIHSVSCLQFALYWSYRLSVMLCLKSIYPSSGAMGGFNNR